MSKSRTIRKLWLAFGIFSLFLEAQQMDGQPSSLSTGIEGTISLGPTHGGPTRAGEVDSAPLANIAFQVVDKASIVTSFTTDASGHFKVPLRPGHYSVKRRDPKPKFPRCGPWQVEVTGGGFAQLHWECDSGMR